MPILKKSIGNLRANIGLLASGFAIALLHISGLLSALIALCHFLLLLVLTAFIGPEHKENIKNSGTDSYIISAFLSFSWAKLFFFAYIKKDFCLKLFGENTKLIVGIAAAVLALGSLYALVFLIAFLRRSFSKERENDRQTAGNNRLNSLQGLRSVAFIAVFISHTNIKHADGLGAWGVSVFFCLSGFLMMYNYLPRQTRPKFGFRFALGKIGKLYPLYIVTMLLALATNLLAKTVPLKDMLLQLPVNIFLLQAWVPKSSVYFSLNGASWYLSAALLAYFCFPLILRFADKHAKIRYGAVLSMLFALEILIAVFAMRFGAEAGDARFSMHWISYISPPARLVDFLVGCCLGAMYLNKSHPPQKTFSYVAQTATVIVILLSLYIYTSGKTILSAEFVKYTLLFSPSSALLIWLTACGGGFAAKLLSHSLLVKIGNISAYTYLLHMVIIRLCNILLKLNIDDSLDLVICAAIAFFWSCVLAMLWKHEQGRFPKIT